MENTKTIYYTPKELAQKIGFHLMTIYKWIKKYNLPITKTPKGRIKIDYKEFLEWWKV